MTRKIQRIGIIVGLLLAGGAAFFLFNRGAIDPVSLSALNFLNFGTADQPSVGGTPTADQPDIGVGISEESAVFTHPDLGFSFEIPEGFSATAFDENNGKMVLVQGETNAEAFQIFAIPFDEPGPITAERIKQDLPKMVMEEVQNITLGGATAIVFFGRDGSPGRTREVWFVWPPEPVPHGNYLYQITAPAEFDEELSRIMTTWKFQ